MKRLHVAILLVIATTGFSQPTERKIASQVKEVTVFLQGAQVTRTSTVEVKPGPSTLVLSGTSPHVSGNSIQVEGNMNVKIVGVSFRVNYLKDLKVPEEAEQLQKERERLSDQIGIEQTSLAIFTEEEGMLKSNKVIGGQTGVNVSELKNAVDYYRQRLIDIQGHKQQINARLAEYQQSIKKIDAQLEKTKVAKIKPEGEIVIKVESKSDVRIQLKVDYLVSEASWFPTYDIRAKDIQSPVAITYKANIGQQSGEDWENVKLTVSSANPGATGATPVLNPWILGFNNVTRGALYGMTAGINANNMVIGQVTDEMGAGLPGVNVLLKGTTNGTVTDSNGRYSMALASGQSGGVLVFSFIGYSAIEAAINGRAVIDEQMNPDVSNLKEVVVTGYGVNDDDLGGHMAGIQLRGARSYREPKIKQVISATPVLRTTALEFTIQNPFTLNSGGQNQSVDMIEYEVPADYQYYSVPKLDNDAFLTARMTEWDNYNFLEGQANIFFEGKYIGKTILDTQNTSDTLTISLGRDKNVVVTREKKKEYSANQFVGSNRKSAFAYEINVRNKKEHPINIRIEDQLPVPNTKDISVDDVENSKAIKNDLTGLLTWNLKVDPGKTEKIDLKYEIKYPRNQNIILE
ncbi:MAG TPA: DUF4139 domain-containing protein [Cyclobacteriaceae bacterium]